MAKTMSPSKPITDGQIDKAAEVYRAMLAKHRNELDSKAVQEVLIRDDYVNEQVGVLRRHAEAASDIVWREVEVDRKMKPQAVIDATGREKYANPESVECMPRGKGKKVRMGFFKLSRFASDDEVAREYELHGLKPDPYAQAKVNQVDPAFADSRPNGCHWKDARGRWHYAAFNRWVGRRRVDVNRNGNGWNDGWWFGGVRK